MQGNEQAQNYLGTMNLKGEGMPHNSLQAIEWYDKAVDHGNREAMMNLASIYENGEYGIKKDFPNRKNTIYKPV